MEPITALLAVVGMHGVSALVQALTGSSELGSLSADLFKALAESESHIDERLSNIEHQLDGLLEQPYRIAMKEGFRYLLDAGVTVASFEAREADLKRAREHFIDATSAAHSPLQQAVAERYLLLSLIGLGRTELVPESLARMESAAILATLDATPVVASATVGDVALLQPHHQRTIRKTVSDLQYPEAETKQAAAQQSIDMCGRLLGEASELASAFGLPPRMKPPGEGSPSHSGDFFPWTFTVHHGEKARVGCITAEFLPAHSGIEQMFTIKSGVTERLERLPVTDYLRLQIDPPLQRAFNVKAASGYSLKHPEWLNRDGILSFAPIISEYLVSAGTATIDVPLSGYDPVLSGSDLVGCAQFPASPDAWPSEGIIRLMCWKPATPAADPSA